MSGKTDVYNALTEVANAFGVLKNAHGKAQQAIQAYAEQLNHDPSLLSQFPDIFSQLGGLKADGDAAGEKRRRGPNKEKKAKDPNAPKRPPSAYIEYQNSVREEFRKQYSELPYSEVLKKIGLVWQNMTDDEKKPWNDITDAKKTEYQENKANYEADLAGKPAVASTSQASPDAPKKRGRPKKEDVEAKAREAAAKVAAAAHAGDIPVEDVKEKKKKASSPKASKKVAAPPSSDDSDSEDDSEDDSDEDDESSESEEEAPPAKKSKKDKKRK